MIKVKTKNSKGFSGRNHKFKRFFRPKTGDLQKKKRLSSQKCHEILCQSTKITKIPLANTNLGLALHFSCPKPVNFFGAQSSLGGAQFSFGENRQSFGGARPRNAPRGAGPDCTETITTQLLILRCMYCAGRLSQTAIELYQKNYLYLTLNFELYVFSAYL